MPFLSPVSLYSSSLSPPDSSTYRPEVGEVLRVSIPSAESVSAHRNLARPSRGLTPTGKGPSGSCMEGSLECSQKRGHMKIFQANFRLPLIWWASHFPALFSSLLVCSPSFHPGLLEATPHPSVTPSFPQSSRHPWYAFLVSNSLSNTLEFLKQLRFHC